ncbi:unnamed protein product [Urochloa decumbens]|uniref:Uncharacterized protein n=1 Tax=Urochloa decumbens TaxID=240449 RepID=A0ABC9D2N4_9POAL
MTGMRSGSKRRRRGSIPAAGGSDDDLISGLGDDVLLRVLELLRDARYAARTGALSRRWRGLWTRVPSLRFRFSSTTMEFDRAGRRWRPRPHGADGTRRFISFVSDALARRAQAADDDSAALEHLTISFVVYTDAVEQETSRELPQQCIQASQGWICCAMESRVKSFVLELSAPLRDCRRRTHISGVGRGGVSRKEQQQSMMNLSELPSNQKLETMHWNLVGASIQLPVTAVFTSLADLLLEGIEFPDDSGHLLARLLSPACCPHLQKLQLKDLRLPSELNELLVESSTLLELSCVGIHNFGLAQLELKTPILQVLRIEQGLYDCIPTLTICSPKLEEITFFEYQPKHINVVDGELSCVRRLKVHLYSHAIDEDYNYYNNNAIICLLRCCTSVTHLEVSLLITKAEYGVVADIIKGRIPHLPHLISLNVHISVLESHYLELHSFGVGLAAGILTQFSNLKYLRVHRFNDYVKKHESFCCDHLDYWKSHEMYLADIQEVEFSGLVGTDCEGWFMQRVLRHAKQLEKVTLRSGGMWNCHGDTYSFYEWKRDL